MEKENKRIMIILKNFLNKKPFLRELGKLALLSSYTI